MRFSPRTILALAVLGCMLVPSATSLASPAPVEDAGENAAPSGRTVRAALLRFLPAPLHARVTFASGGVQERAAKSVKPRPPHRGPAAGRLLKPVVVVTETGPGQAGYVHYFVIESPDGELETQIGIELDDGRIAWSFPELGVLVSPFIKSGQMDVNGKAYAVRHQYGLRPFPDDASMAALRKELWARVLVWVEDGTPYCNLMTRSNELCLSCLGFVMRVLYPPRPGTFLSLPPDFAGASSGLYITTDDLLLYQTGLQGIHPLRARLKRIEALRLPPDLRENLVELVTTIDAADKAAAREARDPAGGSRARRGQARPTQQKKL